MRQIRGLLWARVLEKRPAKLPRARARKGAKAAGLRYERQLAKALPQAKHGQWLEFEDANGLGWAQPDLLLETPWGLAVLEAKYTWVPEGHTQVSGLYIPLLEKCYPARPVFGLVICKALRPETPRQNICRDLATGLYRAASGLPTVVLWTGASLGPLSLSFTPSPLARQAARG